MEIQLEVEALKSRHGTLHHRAQMRAFVSVVLVYVSLLLYFQNSNISLC
jgi:hypothetical protein